VRGQRGPELLEGHVRRVLDQPEDQFGMGLDAPRAAVPAQRLWPGVALLALKGTPTDRTGRADAKARRRLTARHSLANRGKNTGSKIQ
jgi:hypothetical protein